MHVPENLAIYLQDAKGERACSPGSADPSGEWAPLPDTEITQPSLAEMLEMRAPWLRAEDPAQLRLHLSLVQRKKEEKQGTGISPAYKAKEYARHLTEAKFLGEKELVSKRLTSHSESIFLAGVLGQRPSEMKAWAPLSLPFGLCQSGLPGGAESAT